MHPQNFMVFGTYKLRNAEHEMMLSLCHYVNSYSPEGAMNISTFCLHYSVASTPADAEQMIDETFHHDTFIIQTTINYPSLQFISSGLIRPVLMSVCI